MHPLASEKIWFDKSRVEEAESNYYAKKYSGAAGASSAVRFQFLSLLSAHLILSTVYVKQHLIIGESGGGVICLS